MKTRTTQPEYLFVYGSLRRDAEHAVFSKVKEHLKYVGLGYFSGMLFDLGSYPGAVEVDEKGSAKVKGEVYSIADHRNDVFRTLDKYEGFNRDRISKSLFIRKRTVIQLKSGLEVSGWIYLYNRPKRIQKATLIASGDYIKFKKKIA